MSRPATVFTGLLVSGAILYQFRAELSSDMNQVRNQLHNVQNRLSGSVPGNTVMTSHPTSSILEKPKELIDESTAYLQNRIVPTVKDTWNAHIIGLSENVNDLDAEKIKKLALEAKEKFIK